MGATGSKIRCAFFLVYGYFITHQVILPPRPSAMTITMVSTTPDGVQPYTILRTVLTHPTGPRKHHSAIYSDATITVEPTDHSLPLLTPGTGSALTTLELGLLAVHRGHPTESIHPHHPRVRLLNRALLTV